MKKKAYEILFNAVFLLKELRKYCDDSNVSEKVLRIQKETLYKELKDQPLENKDLAWEILIKTGNHRASAAYLGLI